MFQKFTQVDASISRKYGGTGLGLSIVNAIINRHGGKLGAKSTEGKGAEFWFTLPVNGLGKSVKPIAKKIVKPITKPVVKKPVKKFVKREVVKNG